MVLACISGEPEQALIVGMLYTDALNSPSTDEDTDLIQFDNGSYIEHNAADNSLKIHSAGTLDLTAAGNITINGQKVYIN